ncbi:MAG: hypothetical protein EYC71_10675 [Gammaproteobacteria bacterium]|nr:MAG: hypothetical protein EYC71_10675 [Gammaproteobacteria bacterium]
MRPARKCWPSRANWTWRLIDRGSGSGDRGSGIGDRGSGIGDRGAMLFRLSRPRDRPTRSGG